MMINKIVSIVLSLSSVTTLIVNNTVGHPNKFATGKSIVIQGVGGM